MPEKGTTRILTCLVEDSYKLKPSFPTTTRKGDNPKYTVSSCIRAVGLPNLHTGRPHLRTYNHSAKNELRMLDRQWSQRLHQFIHFLYVTSTFQPYVMGSRLTASFNSKKSQSVSAPERKNAPARTQLQCLQFTQHRDTWNFCWLQTKSIRDHMFLHSTGVACGCSRLLTSLRHMVSLIVPNVVLIFRRVYSPEQLSLLACSHVYLLSQIHMGKAKVCSIGLTQRHRNQSVQCKCSMNHEWNGLVHRNH